MSRRYFRRLNGILLLDKALGVSSNKALQDVRFLFGAEKAGHTGSLDPLASGMLPVCFGEATKISAFLLDADKRYVTTATLGLTSTTGDAEGEKLNPRPIPTLDAAALEEVLQTFRGTIQQTPPMYSALKKDGQPLYKLARQGLEVMREARQVVIHELRVLERTGSTLVLAVTCSKGTYIRSLVQDIGEALGCGAYVSQLRREWVRPFASYPLHTLEYLRECREKAGLESLDALLLPLDAGLPDVAALSLDEAQVTRLRYGQRLVMPSYTDCALLRLYGAAGEFVGLGSVSDGILSVRRLLSY